MKLAVFFILTLFLPLQVLGDDWTFTDVSEAANAAFLHAHTQGSINEELSIGAGVAAGDYDNDGDTDLYLVTGNHAPNVLLKNNAGVFSDEASFAGVELTGENSIAPAFADIDGDGWLDLVVGGILGEGYTVFKNTGAGTFSNFTVMSGIVQDFSGQNDYSSAFGDPDRDGDLDLFIAHHSFRFPKGANHFWENDGTGHFTAAEIDNVAVSSTGKDFSFSPSFTDLNRDGWPDLVVASDIQSSTYFMNDGAGNLWVADRSPLTDQFGMGSAVADFDNDGDLDWFVTSIFDRPPEDRGRTGNRLYINDGSGNFTDDSLDAGVRDGQWGWGACAADFNNDGWLDIYHVNGYPAINHESGIHLDDPSRLFINQHDGTFSEEAVALGVADTGQGRGVVCFDYDQDGDIDLFVSNNDGESRLFRNELTDNPGWLQVELLPWPRNKTVAGAFIEIDTGDLTQVREITIGSNFQSQNPLLQHFGLGGAGIVDQVRVYWPNGQGLAISNIAEDQLLTIDQIEANDLIEVAIDDGVSTALAGLENLTYMIVVTNNTASADPSVLVTDTFPDVLSCGWTSEASGGGSGHGAGSGAVLNETLNLPVGSSVTYTVVCSIEPYATGRLTNTVTVSGSLGPWQAIATDNDTVLTSALLSFSNETSAVGLDYTHTYDTEIFDDEKSHISGGLAIGDVNGDGWDDIFAVTGYTGTNDLSAPNSNPNRLFIAGGDGTFTEQAASWLTSPGDGKFSSGPLIADLNDDGRNDLLLGGVRTDPDKNNIKLYLNQNNTSFSDVTTLSGLAGLLASPSNFSMAAGDTDDDGDLDLFVTHWNGSNSVYLMQNNGSAVFTDVTTAKLTASPLAYTFTPVFADLNGDGSTDLLIASDFLFAASSGAGSRYFLNDGTGEFSPQGHPVPISSNKLMGPDENGMGAAVADYDNDGDLDWFVSSIYDPDGDPEGFWGVTGNRLYQNDGTGQFTDVTTTAGVREGYWGWGACFGDFNNDMYLDLYHVNGYRTGPAGEDEFENDPARMFINDGDGTFTEMAVELGVADTPYGRAILCFDNDRDGDLDILVNNNNETSRFFQNNLVTTNHYIEIKLVQEPRNHDAIGAKIELTAGPEPGVTQFRQVMAGANFESSHPTAQHFGLGPNSSVTSITVTWPDGVQETHTDVPADQYLVITRASGEAVVPGAPVMGTATAGEAEASVSFIPPGFTGGAAITGYTVTSSPEGLTGTGAASPITVTGLTNGVAYTFSVTATNSVGTGPASAPSNSVTPKGAQTIIFDNPGPQEFGTTPNLSATASSDLSPTFSSTTPGVCDTTLGGTLSFVTTGTCSIDADQAGNSLYFPAPTVSQSFDVIAVAPGAPAIGIATPGDTQALVSFTPPGFTGGAAITGYTATSSPEGLTGAGVASPITVTGLTNGVAYSFTVTATNPVDTGPASQPSNSVTPRGPQSITFDNPGPQVFGTTPTLSATASSELSPTFSSTTPGVCDTTPAGTLSFVSSGTCAIDANQAGNSAWLPAPTVSQSFDVNAVAPGAPVIGTATPGDGQASITFTPPEFTGGAEITVYTVTSSPEGLTGTGGESPVTVIGLTQNVVYTFTVTATNPAGTGPASEPSNSIVVYVEMILSDGFEASQ